MVYRSTISNNSTIFDVIAVKVVPTEERTEKEVRNLGLLTEKVMSREMPHFPILYGYRACLDACQGTRCIKQTRVPYLVMLNELSAGDQVGFVHRHPSEAVCHSAIMQALVATVALHSLGIVHEDLHDGNVLYHKVSARGSWHYKLGRAESASRAAGSCGCSGTLIRPASWTTTRSC